MSEMFPPPMMPGPLDWSAPEGVKRWVRRWFPHFACDRGWHTEIRVITALRARPDHGFQVVEAEARCRWCGVGLRNRTGR